MELDKPNELKYFIYSATSEISPTSTNNKIDKSGDFQNICEVEDFAGFRANEEVLTSNKINETSS